MSKFHIDEKINKIIVDLNDEICTFERTTGREYTLVLIPHNKDEEIIASVNGKPIPSSNQVSLDEIFISAVNARNK